MTHSLYVKLSKNSKDYGEPDITYQLAGSAEQRPLGIPMGDACSARTSTAFKPPRFQESAMKLEDSISDFRKILMFATNRSRISGIRTGNGRDGDGLQQSALSLPPSQPVFLESGTSRAELYD